MTLPIFAQVTNYATEAADRPIDQYKGLPRLLGWILSYVNRCQELENAAWDVILKRMIDNAQNAQLDTIGKIVGQSRGTQADAVYRVYITARIRINRSQGHADDVISVLMLIDSAAFSWTESYPASALIQYTTTPSADPGVLLSLAKLAVSSGVQLELVAPAPGADPAYLFTASNFGDSGDPNKGFGALGSTAYGGQLSSVYG